MSLRADVDRGLQIRGQIDVLQRELAEIEGRLEKAGLEGDQVELEDPEREGRQFLARGSGAIVPVVFTADLLVKSFSKGSVAHGKVLGALPDEGLLTKFFRPVHGFATLHESGKHFRAAAAGLLGDAAPAFVSACLQRDKHGTPKSNVRIEWHRAEFIAAQQESEVAA